MKETSTLRLSLKRVRKSVRTDVNTGMTFGCAPRAGVQGMGTNPYVTGKIYSNVSPDPVATNDCSSGRYCV